MDRPPRVLWLTASLLLLAAIVVLTLVVGSAQSVGAASDVVLVEPLSFTVSEPDGQGAFTITLTIQPTAAVTVGLTVTSTECTVDPGSILLTADNWDTGASASVTAQDDAVVDGPQTCGIETAAAVSADPSFSGEDPDDVMVTVIDDDGPMDASIGDYVWFDQNGDGIQDETEIGLSGIIVYLDLDNDTTLDPGEPFDTTDAGGAYDITALAAGPYSVRVDNTTLPIGYRLTTANMPLTIILADSQDYNEADFGYEGYALDVSVVGDGSVLREPDQPTYLYGTPVILTPTATLDWTFAGWSGSDADDLSDNGDGSWSLSMDASKMFTATFTQVQFTLTVNVDGSGSVDKNPDLPTYTYGTSVVLTPTATLGWSFADWGGPDKDALSDNGDGSWSITMDGDKRVTANFTEDLYTLAVTLVGSGSVDRNPDLPTYTYGTPVVLTPTATLDWTFAGWSGPNVGDLTNNGDGSWSITMDASKVLTATFTQDEYTLDVTVIGDGSVLKEPDQLTYTYGTPAVLTPTASLDWTFAGWSGPNVGDLTNNGDGSWSITMDASKELTATFTLDEYTLDVTVVGDGSVLREPDQLTYTYGTPVVLTPTATLDWTFAGWSGPNVGDLTNNSDGSWSLSMDASKVLTATFTQDQYTLDVTVVGDGSVLREPDQLTYTYGTSVVLTPTASLDWTFASWSGPNVGDLTNNGDGSWSLSMNASKILTATFTQDEYTLDVTVVGDGSVDRNPDQLTYTYGTPVVLTPTASLDWTFAGWSGPDVGDLTNNGDGSWSITMDASKVLTATFLQDQYTLDVTVVGDGSVLREPDQLTYTYGTSVVLTPTASLDWTFASWSGPNVGDLTNNGDGSWSLSMNASKILTATFTQDEYTLDVTVVGDGSVDRNPDQLTYTYGTPVVLTPTASLDWSFASWSGPNAGDLSDNGDGSWSITMDASKELIATFTFPVHLPMIMIRWPPTPAIPSLNPIDNGDGNGSYTVSWSAAAHAATYVLQEATQNSFSDATIIFSGPATSHAVSGRGAARYYYRVKACNIWAESGWSNVRQSDVLWEAEPNEAHQQANGPIMRNLVYYGTFPDGDDINDYYFFDLTAARRVKLWLTDIPSGQNYDLILRDASLTVRGYSGNLSNSDEYIRTDSILPTGRYYIQVHHRSSGGSIQPYSLRFALE